MAFLSPLMLLHSLWTLAGLLLGLGYGLTVSDDGAGLGTPFTVGVAVAAVALAVIAFVKARPHTAWVASFGVVFFLLFGLLLPAWAS